MNTSSIVRSTVVASLLLYGSRAADAACVISGVKPTVALPTMAAGQQFSFIATADCETLRFRVPDTTLTKIPKAGPGLSGRHDTYKVVLTEREWNSVVDGSDTTFTWSIIGTTSAGVTTRVTTTNELVIDRGVSIDLSLADATFMGEPGDGAGHSVSGAGDVDGDGHADVLVGAPYDADGGSYAGAAYLVLGPDITGSVDLSLAAAKLVGEEASDLAGTRLAGAADVDGDGHDDVLIAASGNDEGGSEAGAAYLVLGPVTGDLDLSGADAKLVGEEIEDLVGYSGAYSGNGVAGAGDVDGDGHADLLVGASRNDAGGRDAGAAYLVLGPTTGTLDLSGADAKLVGEERNNAAGGAVSGAGDVDGDGNDDVLVGAKFNGLIGTGAAYLVLGPVTGTLDLAFADAKLVGEDLGDSAGVSVAGAGDVDDDGHADLLVGAVWHEDGAGAAYLVLGPVTGELDLSLADAKLVGEDDFDNAGYSVSGAGDVDGDSYDDLLVGAFGNSEGGSYAGAAYVVLGPVTGSRNLATAEIKLVGEESIDQAGASVSGAGDVDGDGRDDVLVGSSFGAAYLIYGGGPF